LAETSPSHWVAKEGEGVVGALGAIVLAALVVGDVVRPVDVAERAASDGEIGLVRLALTWAVPPAEPPCPCDHEGVATSARLRLRVRPTVFTVFTAVFIVRPSFGVWSILDMKSLLPLPPEGDVAAEARTAKCRRGA
jgi:hypothetical protein